MVNKKQLKRLADLFPSDAPLYAVGGFVRDELLKLESHDVDICSKLTVDEVKSVLLTSDFAVSDKNLRVGTVGISARNFSAEYTTFRTDSYPVGSGVHAPDEVTFTEDITLDALRRDFGCNALYYDILKDEIVDPLNRIGDVTARIIKTADAPDKVFSADGLRILRMVRFASELGFTIDPETLAAAKKYSSYVGSIAAERINEELNKIFVADTAHLELGLNDAHYSGITLLDELGLVDLLLPEVAALKGLQQNPIYHLYDAYVHTLMCFKVAAPEIRWAALLHDIGKRPCFDSDGNTYAHPIVGAELSKLRLETLKKPKNEIKRICSLIMHHMVNINGDMSESKQRWFVAEHADIASDLALLKDADATAAKGSPLDDNWVRRIFAELKSEGAPFSVRELVIDGNDLISLGVDGKMRGILLYELWRDTVMNMNLNDRDKALAYVEKRSKK